MHSSSQESSSDISHPAIAGDAGPHVWPIDTDLIFLSGSNKVMITIQRPLIRVIIQDAIERTRATMMFSNAFPNVFDVLEFISEALVEAAEDNKKAKDIHNRLRCDHEYIINMSRLVSY
jgi:hypothetical protein